jgi:DNA-directed RNA polymerase specialized sigma subunit
VKERFAKYPFRGNAHGLTMFEVTHVYQLTPPPPELYTVNEYIVAAQTWHDLRFFAYFLHHIEPRLNGRVRNFLLREGLDKYDPERFLDYKQSCVIAMLECLESYDPYKGAEFLTYAHHAMGNALIQCRMMEESGSFASLDEYKRVRGIAWLYNETGKSKGEVVSEYAKKEGCSEETAEQYLTVARLNRSQVSLYVIAQDEDGEETGEDVTRDDSWDYAAILWNGTQAAAVQAAFEKLTYREQQLLEERNAICMTCGRVSPLSERKSFEELAVMFEGSTASGAERAYRRIVEKLTLLLVEDGALHAVRLKRKSVKRKKKKIAAAVYEYQADCDGEWGEIQFDFVNGTAEIVRLAEWDTMVSKMFAKEVIRHFMDPTQEKLVKGEFLSRRNLMLECLW